MAVFWTIQARRHLRQALVEALCREDETAIQRQRQRAEATPAWQDCPSILDWRTGAHHGPDQRHPGGPV